MEIIPHSVDPSQAPHRPTKWTDRLAFDVALLLENSGETMDEVIARHRISSDDIITYNTDPIFLKKVAAFRDEIQEKGVTFRLKARAQAEELLMTSWQLIHSPDVSPSVKADLIKSTVKWGDLEPKQSALGQEGGGGVSITINLGEQDTPTPLTITQESNEVENAVAIDTD